MKKKILLGPVITIIVLTIVIIAVSAILSFFNVQGEVTKIVNGTLETQTIGVKSLFSEEGFKYIFSSKIFSISVWYVNNLALLLE